MAINPDKLDASEGGSDETPESAEVSEQLKKLAEEAEQTGEMGQDSYGSDMEESLKESLKRGGHPTVKIGRSSGEIEDGWTLTGVGKEGGFRVSKWEHRPDSHGHDVAELKEKSVTAAHIKRCAEFGSSEKEEQVKELMQKDFENANTVDGLIEIIGKFGGIRSSRGLLFEAEYIRKVIAAAEKDTKDIDLIPRTAGLRDKVREILEKE